jgi:hypothetical protein
MFEICLKKQLSDKHPEAVFKTLWKEDVLQIWDKKSNEEKFVYKKLMKLKIRTFIVKCKNWTRKPSNTALVHAGTRLSKCFKAVLHITGNNVIEVETFFCPILWYMFESHLEKNQSCFL